MNFKKIKRTFSIGIAAVMCFAMTLSVPASAKTDNEEVMMWKEVKAMTGAKYNSKYIKWVEKYSEKDTSKTVVYSKSRTKKFIDELEKASQKDEPQFALNMINEEIIISKAVKGDKIKTVVCMGSGGTGFCGNSNEITIFDIEEKEKLSLPKSKALEKLDFMTELSEMLFDLDIDDDEEGKLFKFKSGEKIYYYEYFEDDRTGFLFSESGKVLAGYIIGTPYCINVSNKIDDSAFNIPTGYKDVDYDYWF